MEVREGDVQALARRLAAATRPGPAARLRSRLDPDEALLAWAVARPAFKVQLFRLVDALPACRTAADVAAHLEDHLDQPSSPTAVRAGLHVARALPGGDRLAAGVTTAAVRRMARRFIAGTTADDAAAALGRLWSSGFAGTVDLLGERTLTLADSARYADRLVEMVGAITAAATGWPARPRVERDPWGPLPRANISIKASALAPLLGPLTVEAGVAEALERLAPVIELARQRGATLHFDTEYDELKDATFTLLREVGRRHPDGPTLGCVVQAYRRDALVDLEGLADWSASTLARPLQVRLVKGAYWDAETIVADAHGWPTPVWSEKAESDANYERAVDLLVARAGDVRPAFASHNLRSLAYALTATGASGLADDAVETQVLYGMAPELADALRDLGGRVRVYVPVGELVPGMAYLVRRLLENTSNESFLRQRSTSDVELERLLTQPRPHRDGAAARAPVVDAAVDGLDDPGPFVNEPEAELRRAAVRDRYVAAVRTVPLGFAVPVAIGGEERAAGPELVSVDPGRTATLVCRATCATVEDVHRALDLAARAAGVGRPRLRGPGGGAATGGPPPAPAPGGVHRARRAGSGQAHRRGRR